MTLGQLLKQKRTESGRSLEQLSASTKIHIKILAAIENDAYSELPARAFTRGFIVNYAKALKLNPDELLTQYRDFLEARFTERRDRDQGHQGYAFEGKELEQNRRWLVVGASIAVVFATATLLIFRPQNHKHREQHKEFEKEASETPALLAAASPGTSGSPGGLGIALSSASPAAAISGTQPTMPLSTPAFSPAVSAVSSPAATPVGTPEPVATPVASATPKSDHLNKGDDLDPRAVKMKVMFQALQDVWIRYESDEKPVGMVILRKDRYLSIKATTQLIASVSNPSAVQYKTRGGYQPLTQTPVEILPDGSVKEYSGARLGAAPFPEIPPPKTQN